MPSTSTTVRGRRRPEAAPAGQHYRARVTRVRHLTPRMLRVSFVGEDLAALPSAGPDQRVQLLLPQPDGARPVVRPYTVRRHRPAAAEIDVDVALHDPPGPGSAWARSVEPGDEVLLFGPAAEFRPPAGTSRYVLVGDETALPAIGAIVESLGFTARAWVLVEIADAAERQEFRSSADVRLRWLTRAGRPAHESRLLLGAIRDLKLEDPASTYAWVAGEAAVATAVTRHLIDERRLPGAQVTSGPYWRYGRAAN
jgi:NADPH-dependent ferric siderophore reductase